MRVIIDGYNLLNIFYSGFEKADPDIRDSMIGELVAYKRAKGADITVVFDSKTGHSIAGNRYKDRGINIVFTQRGKTADDEIVDILKNSGEGIIVVTSDHDLKDRVERYDSICISSDLFASKMEEMKISLMKGVSPDIDYIYREKPKKGPAKRKSKKERKRARILPKL